MKFIAEKVHVQGDLEIQACFIVLLIFSELSSKVPDANLRRAKETASWDHKGSPYTLQVQGEKAK